MRSGGTKYDKELVQILLEYAVWTSNVPVVRFCLENGASFSDLNTESTGAAESLLCHMKYDVYKKEHPEFNEVILQKMAESGCDLNHQMIDGNTVLHLLATQNYAAGSIRMAIRYGADPTMRNHFGETPYDVAVAHDMPDSVVESLRYMY